MKHITLFITLFIACITLLASFEAYAVVVRHGARGTVVRRPAGRVVAPARRVWVPGHYYRGVWVAGTYVAAGCKKWIAGHYSHGRWINGYCAD